MKFIIQHGKQVFNTIEQNTEIIIKSSDYEGQKRPREIVVRLYNSEINEAVSLGCEDNTHMHYSEAATDSTHRCLGCGLVETCTWNSESDYHYCTSYGVGDGSPYNTYGCGNSISHSYVPDSPYTNEHYCSFCMYRNTHQYENGSCSICGYVCTQHDFGNNSDDYYEHECNLCGFKEEHEWKDLSDDMGHTCKYCDKRNLHVFSMPDNYGHNCSYCGYGGPHGMFSYYDENTHTCGTCGYNVVHSFMDSGDMRTCSDCGYSEMMNSGM